MFPKDVEVWERFLDKYGDLYNEFAYDVRVGKKTWVHPRWEEAYKRDAQILSKLRIDVVGHRERVIDIIEVKPRFNSAAIGQVLTYKDAFIKDFAPSKPVRAVVVAKEIDPNILPLIKDLNVVYIQA